MGPELVALATSAATTLVNAMATDAWQTVRAGVARLLGRGDATTEQMTLETLDEDAATLASEPTVEARQNVTAGWVARLRDLLRSNPDAAEALRELVAEAAASLTTVSAAGHGAAAGRDMHIEASHGSVAAATIHGSVTVPHPSRPGTHQA